MGKKRAAMPHRHNIYRRLHISSQSELFQLFIQRI